MNRLLLSFLFLAILAAVCLGDEKYTTRYDNIDVVAILKNDRLLKNYVDCALNKGKCNKEGEELKRHIKDAIENACEQCSEKQKTASINVCKHLVQRKPEYWKQLIAFYDPDGKYQAKHSTFLDKCKTEHIDY